MPSDSTFAPILERALSHHEEAVLRSRLPVPLERSALAALPDDRVLAALAQRIFSAGFRWSVVRQKWPEIEEAFDSFAPATVAAYEAPRLAALQADRRIIRHPGKIRAIVDNAATVVELAREHGSAAQWLADWPADDVVGLWHELARRFRQMGGMSGPYVLRSLGVDTFLLTGDVLRTLAEEGLYSGKGTGKRDRRTLQVLFNRWREETGESLGALSLIAAAAAGPG